ncbi:MAG: PQQ-binding-like beta-propeller repeat protein [Bacteroidales bacterium]|nr:PQQ-binding-like beta-propeller repeat protein [Bacteroidales bacterium]
MKTYLSILLLVFFLTCCNKGEIIGIQFDDNGVIISLPYQWKKSLHADNVFHSNSYFRTPIKYNNNIAIPTTDANSKRYMTMINSNNGKTIWKWSDITDMNTDYIDISYIYTNGNLLTYQFGSWSVCINIDNGTTHWKIIRNSSFHKPLSGIGNTYFSKGESESMYPQYSERVGYKGNLQTGEIEEFLIPNFSLDYIMADRIGSITAIVPYMINEVQHLVIVYQEPASLQWDFQSFLGLYNYETNQWVYERKIMNEPNLNGVLLSPPTIYNNNLYANIGKELVCHDITTGKQIWNKQFTQDFLFSGFIIEEDKIIANNENLTLYCLDPETGNEIWTGKGAGTSSRMSYLNGIVYFVGGSDGKFHAVDISTGKTVWRLNAEIIEGNDGIFNTNAVYVIPGTNGNKGKVIALTHMYAYCFEAYK